MNDIKDERFTNDNNFIDKKFGAIYTIEYSIDSGATDGISNPEYLQHLDNLTVWLRTLPIVSNVLSYSDIIKRLNENMHGDSAQYYRIPDTKDYAAQLLLLYELSLPYGQDFGHLITADKSATRLLVAFPSTDSNSVLQLQDEISQWMHKNLPSSMYHVGTSYVLMASHAASTTMIKSIEGSIVALAIITLTIMVALRSVKYGLISVVPNIFPAAIGFGFWAVYSGELGINLVSVLGITIGIIVDDTVHFLSKYLRARREKHLSTTEAVQYAFNTVGPAIWVTSVILIIGFVTLAFSQFRGNADVGLITTVIIGSALLLDLFMLPPLLMLFDRERKPVDDKTLRMSENSKSNHSVFAAEIIK
jgi:predicted RND superfamily exporter protein